MAKIWIDPTPQNTCAICNWHKNRVYPDDALLPLPAHPNCECYYEDTDAEPQSADYWIYAPKEVLSHWLVYVKYLLREGEEIPPALEFFRTLALIL